MPIINKLRAVLILLIIPFLIRLIEDAILLLDSFCCGFTMIVSTLLTKIILIWIKLKQFFAIRGMT